MSRYQRAIPAIGPSSSDRNGLPPGGGYTWRGKPDLRKLNAAIVAMRSPHAMGARGQYEPAPCGTTAGYQRHKRLHESACEPCRLANAAASRKHRKRRVAA